MRQDKYEVRAGGEGRERGESAVLQGETGQVHWDDGQIIATRPNFLGSGRGDSGSEVA